MTKIITAEYFYLIVIAHLEHSFLIFIPADKSKGYIALDSLANVIN